MTCNVNENTVDGSGLESIKKLNDAVKEITVDVLSNSFSDSSCCTFTLNGFTYDFSGLEVLHEPFTLGLISGIKEYLTDNITFVPWQGLSSQGILDRLGFVRKDWFLTGDAFKKGLYTQLEKEIEEVIINKCSVASNSEAILAFREGLWKYRSIVEGGKVEIESLREISDNWISDKVITSDVFQYVCKELGIFIKEGCAIIPYDLIQESSSPSYIFNDSHDEINISGGRGVIGKSGGNATNA